MNFSGQTKYNLGHQNLTLKMERATRTPTILKQKNPSLIIKYMAKNINL